MDIPIVDYPYTLTSKNPKYDSKELRALYESIREEHRKHPVTILLPNGKEIKK